MKKMPEIRINFAYLLYDNESKQLAGNIELQSEEKYREWTDNYRTEWEKNATKILTALQAALGVEFYRQVIDVACAPFFIPKSDPLIMNFRHRPDQFADVLMHELCHVLLTDNNKIQINAKDLKLRLGDIWTELFGDHPFHLLVHIPVHALSEHVYLDVLKDKSRLERDKKACEDYGPAYTESWRYVEKNGYKEIIRKLRKSYEEMLA